MSSPNVSATQRLPVEPHLIMVPSMSRQQGGKQYGHLWRRGGALPEGKTSFLACRYYCYKSDYPPTPTHTPMHAHTQHTPMHAHTQQANSIDCGEVLFAVSASCSTSAGPSEATLRANSAYACGFSLNVRECARNWRTPGYCVSTRSLAAPRLNRDKRSGGEEEKNKHHL